MNFKFEINEIVKDGIFENEHKILDRAYDRNWCINKYFTMRVETGGIHCFNELDIKSLRLKIELKPCPICGNKNIVFYDDGIIINYYVYYDEIDNHECGIICDYLNGGCGLSTGNVDINTSIRQWNEIER